MPRAFDLRNPQADKNPLYTTLNFEDPTSAIGEGARRAGDTIRNSLPGTIQQQTGLNLFDPSTWPVADFSWWQGLVDGITQAFTRDTQVGWDLGAAIAAMAQQKNETTDIAAGLAQLRADQNAQFVSGKSAVITVSDHSGIPTGFTKFSDTGAGTVTNDGNSLEMSNDDGRELFVYGNLELQTDAFEVSVIAPTRAMSYFGAYGTQYIYLLGRANDPTNPTTFTFARVGGNRVRFGAVKAGTANNSLANPYWFAAEASYPWGSYLTFRGGIPGEDRAFQLLVNNQIRELVNDTSDFSEVGAGFRYTGFGIENQNYSDGINRSFGISHIAINDNAPPPVVGVACKISRANTAGKALDGSLAGSSYEMDDVFDNTDYISSEYFTVTNMTLGIVEILKDGQYLVDFRAESVTPFTSVNVSSPPHYLMPYLRIDPATGSDYDGPRGIPASSARDGFANALGVNAMAFNRAIPLKAGDKICVRFNIGSSIIANQWIGDSAGTKTFMTITLANWSVS